MQIATQFYNSVYSVKMKLNIEAIHHVQAHLWIVDHSVMTCRIRWRKTSTTRFFERLSQNRMLKLKRIDNVTSLSFGLGTQREAKQACLADRRDVY